MNRIKKTVLIVAALISFAGLQGCSGLAPYKSCIDCTQFPLVYQGTVTKYTQGVYIETACLTVDLSKFSGFENFQIGDIVHIEYVIKQGEFCADEDSSTYRLYTVKNDKDYDIPAELFGTRDGIKLK